MKRNGQASFELLILAGFLLLAFVLFFTIIQANMSDKVRARANAEVQEIATTIQTEIDLATNSINGYRRSFTIPTTRYLGDYTLLINNSIVFVTSEDENYIFSATTGNVTGQPVKGTNNIRKENGTIYLNT